MEWLTLQPPTDKEAGLDGVTVIPASDGGDKEAIIDAVVSIVMTKLDGDIQNGGVRPLLERVWKEAYKSDSVQGEYVSLYTLHINIFVWQDADM